MLLNGRALVNIKNAVNGRTPLFLAAEVGNKEMVKLLLKHKAKINARDEYGNNVQSIK